MSNKGRPKKLPSDKKDINVQINLTRKQKNKLDQICQKRQITQSEYFRSILVKDNDTC
jgi:hypothetical protein